MVELRERLSDVDQELLILRVDKRMSWRDMAMVMSDDEATDLRTLQTFQRSLGVFGRRALPRPRSLATTRSVRAEGSLAASIRTPNAMERARPFGRIPRTSPGPSPTRPSHGFRPEIRRAASFSGFTIKNRMVPTRHRASKHPVTTAAGRY